jgi:hypothetical protein
MIKIKRGWERHVNKTDSDLVWMNGNGMNE